MSGDAIEHINIIVYLICFLLKLFSHSTKARKNKPFYLMIVQQVFQNYVNNFLYFNKLLFSCFFIQTFYAIHIYCYELMNQYFVLFVSKT